MAVILTGLIIHSKQIPAPIIAACTIWRPAYKGEGPFGFRRPVHKQKVQVINSRHNIMLSHSFVDIFNCLKITKNTMSQIDLFSVQDCQLFLRKARKATLNFNDGQW